MTDSATHASTHESGKTVLPYGTWQSPVTYASLAGAKRFGDVQWDSDGKTLVWLEIRSGQGVLVVDRGDGNAPADLTTDLSVRAEVGYGGGDFTVYAGHVYFVAQKTGRIHRLQLSGGNASPITPQFGKAASPAVSPDGKWLAYVHSDDEGIDRIAVVDTEGRHWPQILASGQDFYMQPCWSPDGKSFAYIGWNHPQMPWDGTLLHLGTLKYSDSGLPRIESSRVIAGDRETAILQPEFSRDSRQLFYISDETGWTQLWAHELESGRKTHLTHDEVEHGMPAWTQGMRNYAVSGDGRSLFITVNERGFFGLCRFELESGKSASLHERLPRLSYFGQLAGAPTGNRVAFIASGPSQPPQVISHDFATGHSRVHARSMNETIPVEHFSVPEAASWPTAGGEVAHGLFYRPTHPRFEGRGTPPLIVLVHGGPTAQAVASWDQQAQFFTSRGYAVLQLNYRGSTGYGREYMLKLRNNWGICDVEDALSARHALIRAGRVDPERTVIMGGSAGGYTVLQTMVDAPDAFTAGINLFGISNQFTAATDTHKFESRYNDSLMGALPEASAVYRKRSPIFHAERIKRPLAVFQGEEDQVVWKDQSDAIVEALRRTGTPVVYHVYAGEGHGWRKRETIVHFYQEVEKFLRQHVLYG